MRNNFLRKRIKRVKALALEPACLGKIAPQSLSIWMIVLCTSVSSSVTRG